MTSIGAIHARSVEFVADPADPTRDGNVEIHPDGSDKLIIRKYDAGSREYANIATITKTATGGDLETHANLEVAGNMEVRGGVKIMGSPANWGSHHAVTVGYLGHAAIETLSQSPDVAISNPVNGQVLRYDSATQKWVNSFPQTTHSSEAFVHNGAMTAGLHYTMKFGAGGEASPPLPFALELRKVSLLATNLGALTAGTQRDFVVSLYKLTHAPALLTTAVVSTVVASGTFNGQALSSGSLTLPTPVQVPANMPMYVTVASQSHAYSSITICAHMSGYTS
eukprot:jgi/Mesvir1/24173/Mv10890-RA.1